MGLFGGGNSSQSTTNLTENIDRRLAIGNGSMGLAGDNSFFNINQTDGGIAKAALDFAKGADATNGAGFSKLLDTERAGLSSIIGAQTSGLNTLVSAQSNGLSDVLSTMAGLFKTQSDNATSLAGQTQQAVLSAYTNAASDKTSTIDNRTIVTLALVAAGIAAVFFMSKRAG